jgi:hypothetical protein
VYLGVPGSPWLSMGFIGRYLVRRVMARYLRFLVSISQSQGMHTHRLFHVFTRKDHVKSMGQYLLPFTKDITWIDHGHDVQGTSSLQVASRLAKSIETPLHWASGEMIIVDASF